jgi:hypothetical protein
MRRNPLVGALGGVVSLGVLAFPAGAQPDRQLDTRAVFRTAVPDHSPHPPHTPAGSGTATPSAAAVFGGSPYAVGPVITPTSTLPEAEEHVAADPNQAASLVAVVSDFALRGGFNTSKCAVSLNNGTSWTEQYVPLDASGFPVTREGKSWQANSDPVAAIDKLGNVYLANLYFDTHDNANGLYVGVASWSSGVNFAAAATYPVATNLNPATSISEDKPWIAVDNSSSSSSGNVYASWTRFVGNTDMILFSRSTNHGVTWSAPVAVSPVGQNGAVQGSQVAVGPNGELYVVYEVFYVGGLRRQFLARSTNGGVTFSAPVAITPYFNELRFNSTYRKSSFAALAVSPVNGNVYLVYADQPSSTLGAEVEFVRSTTGGASFTAPVVINDRSAGQQFMPALTVDSTGRIHASWFDTRNSPGTASRYDIFATRSLDNGTTFSPNARITPALVNAGTASFIGDYAGIAAAGGFAHPVWTSGGFNNGRLQTATLQ